MSRSRNPAVGEHPDLFEGKPTRVVRALELMSEEEIRALPRSAFSQAEWDSLDEDVQEYIVANDPIAQDEEAAREKRIETMVTEFVKRHKWLEDPDEGYLRDRFDGSFDYEFSDHAVDIINHARQSGYERQVEEIEERFTGEGYSTAQVEEALKEALQDNNNYDYEYNTSEYGRAMFKAVTDDSFSMEREEIDEVTEGMSEDEIEEALKEINRKTYLSLKPQDLAQKYGLDIYEYATYYADADPNWEKVEAAVAEKLHESEPEEELEQGPDADRVLMNFPDGSYARQLHASELADEGKKMGICVGRAEYGYAKAVRANRTMIISLRRPSGKPLLTFELRLSADGRGSPEEMVQIKGKANRLPGWDLGRVGQGDVKADEVQKAIEVVEMFGLDPRDVRDLEPGLRALKGLPPRRTNHGDGAHCGFCQEPE